MGHNQKEKEALGDSLALYHSLIQISPDAVVIVDASMKITMVNNQAALLYGCESAHEMIGKDAIDFVAEEDKERFMENVKKTIVERTLKNVEYALLRKDGTYFSGEISASVVFDQDGNPKAFIGVIRDITERKKQELALKESEQKYRTIVENTNDLIMLTAPSGAIIYLSPACRSVLGQDPKDLLGKEPWIIHHDDIDQINALFSQALEGASGTNIQYRITTQKGLTKWVSHSWSPIVKEDGTLEVIVSVIRDITDSKLAQVALRDSKRLLEKALYTLHDAVFIFDIEMQAIIDCNPAASKIFGYTRHEMLQFLVIQLYSDEAEYNAFKQSVLAQIQEKRFLCDLNFNLKRKNGSVFPCRHTIMPLDDDKGMRMSWVCIMNESR